MFNFRTDLANERRDIYKKANKIENEIPGVDAEEEQINENINVTRVKITDDSGVQALGKPIGSYITIDVNNLKIADENEIQEAADSLAKELKVLIDKNSQIKDDILIVGLGNLKVTPDALGPKVVSYIDITRHLLEYVPDAMDKDTRPVSAISPGVLGTTGIETLEILKGVVQNIKVKLIIVIDALASRSMARVSNTIQLADTGITPGAGVGNRRQDISIETLGVPVIAIGVPTVVDVATITSDAIDIFIEQNKDKNLEWLSGKDKYEMIKEALIPKDYNFIVTPKEIDELIDNMSNVVARGINLSLQ